MKLYRIEDEVTGEEGLHIWADTVVEALIKYIQHEVLDINEDAGSWDFDLRVTNLAKGAI